MKTKKIKKANKKEYFVVANSFAAPFFSDTAEEYTKGVDPEDAMQGFVRFYGHPCGLYSVALYKSADPFHKSQKPLCKWLCNLELEKQRLTKGKGSYSFLHSADKVGHFIEIDHERHYIPDPGKGCIVPARGN